MAKDKSVTITAEEPSSHAADGSSLELPITRPFEGYTYLRKEWADQEDGIEKVTINTTFSHLQQHADWNHTESFTMMPEWGTTPLHRTWIIRLPTHLDGHDRYLFHYFFHVFYSNGTERVSNTFTQMVAPQPFEFIDYAGDCAFVRLHWSIGNWAYPQDTEFECDGIEWGGEFSVSNLPYRKDDRLFHNGRFLVMNRLPIPRHFRGLIWAPRGSEIRYCFQLLKQRPDGLQMHWENNQGGDFTLTV